MSFWTHASKLLREHLCFMGVWIHLSRPTIKCLSDSDKSNSTMFLFYLLPQMPLTLSDPPWSILLLWRSWVIRRILVHRVIVSLILAPCWARGSATVARRSLVISHVSSHHTRRAFLVFVRAKMCGHLPLVCSIKCLSGKPQASLA